ncbi:MAG: MotA/TolQ/ExbB proton channel family protein [Planctomycetaceae bacterium]|nr:MotA/TolQ/ExbB proton channel family protein [Planctomycetaceae bacterium]
MTDRLVELLYLISTGLLTPTLVMLLVFMGAALIMCGGLMREALDRWIHLRSWRRLLSELRCGGRGADRFYTLALVGYPARLQSRTMIVRDESLLVQKSLDDLEMDIARRLGWLAFATRVGPLLGLVGTLVPLGPALTGLASGDIQALSGNLVIAFTTTVFGVLIGGSACGAGIIRRAWYAQDLSDLEFVVHVRRQARSSTLPASPNGSPEPCHPPVENWPPFSGAVRHFPEPSREP